MQGPTESKKIHTVGMYPRPGTSTRKSLGCAHTQHYPCSVPREPSPEGRALPKSSPRGSKWGLITVGHHSPSVLSPADAKGMIGSLSTMPTVLHTHIPPLSPELTRGITEPGWPRPSAERPTLRQEGRTRETEQPVSQRPNATAGLCNPVTPLSEQDGRF